MQKKKTDVSQRFDILYHWLKPHISLIYLSNEPTTLKILLFIFLLLTANILYAQPYYFKHYQVENGLSNNSVFASIQDHHGFMWFGTKNGLNRFDGYSIKTYRNDPENPKSLGNDKVFSLCRDKASGLWIGTENGLYRYDPVNETFKIIKETSDLGIGMLGMDMEGNLWGLTGDRVFSYNPHKNSFAFISMGTLSQATSIYCRKNGQVLMTSPEGNISMYDKKTRSFKIRYLHEKGNKGEMGWISAISETDDQKLLLGTTDQGIKLFDLRTNVLKNLITFNKDKTHIYVRAIQDLNNEFWIGTESGVYIYHHRKGTISHLQKQYNNPYTLSDNAIYTVCRDKDGGIWMGTYFGGVNYYSAQSSIFTKYFPGPHDNAISGSAVREIVKDRYGNLWIGTEDAGLNKLNPKTGKFTAFFPTGSKYSIAHSNIHALLADGDQVWVGTFQHGLDLMDIHTGLITRHYQAGAGNSLKSNFILNIYKTRANEIIVATTYGIYHYNRKKDDFDAIPGLPYFFYNNIIEDSSGTIWAGTYNDGLLSFRLGDSTYKNYRHDARDKNSLANNIVNGIFEDSRKNIWIATDGGGLSLLHKDKSGFKSYTVADGLPSNYLFRIQEDEDYKLWISSTRGLFRFDPLKKTIKTYTRSDGLLTDQFNYNSAYKDTDGRMFFGSLKGLVSFQPAQLKTTSKTAPIFLTGFQIDNTGSRNEDTVLNKSILYTREIKLNHNQSSFSIDFAALSYFSPEMTEYAYKMSGLYSNWEYLKTNRKVYFTKLAPGTYIFQAKAMISGSSEWSKDNIKLYITVLPPFWETPLAYLVYGLFILCIVTFLIWQYHRKTVLKNNRRMELFEHEKEKEIYQAKIEFFTNVAHEIRTPLTLIKGPMEKLIKNANEFPVMEKNLKTMNRNTDRLISLTNQLLDFRKTEIHGFSLNFVKANISELLMDIALQFQFAAENKNINYETILPEQQLYAYVDVEALYKIMSNLVDNAVKYGKSELKVSLNIDKGKDQFIIRVLNNGCKIAPELKNKIFEPFFRAREAEMKQGTGIGLSISKSLAELHRGHLYLDEGDPDFNIFVLRLPIHQTMEFNLKGKWKKM